MTASETTTPEIDRLVEIAKLHKTGWAEVAKCPDMPPSVIIEKDNDVLLTIVTPQVNKYLALDAAYLMKKGFDPDSITLILDAHMSLAEGKTEEEAKKMMEKYSEPGSMQKACDENHACSLGEITDCMIVMKIDRNGRVLSVSIPYDYHDHKDAHFTWYGENKVLDTNEEGTGVTGLIPDTLRQIMNEPTLLEEVKELDMLFPGLGQEEKEIRSGRAAISVMLERWSVEHQGQTLVIAHEKIAQYGPIGRFAVTPINEWQKS